MAECHRRRRETCLGVTGVMVLMLTITSIPVMDIVMTTEINKRVVLEEGSMVYSIWKSPSDYLPLYNQFYVFDLRNADEVKKGGKPYMVEKGPYTYREVRQKWGIVHHPNDTVTYRENITYEFVEDMSVGSEYDKFTTANMVAVALANAVQFKSVDRKKLDTARPRSKLHPLCLLFPSGGLEEAISLLLDLFKEEPFLTLTVHDMVWGYKDRLLTIGAFLFPNWFTTRRVGALAGRNQTDDGVFTVFTGKDNISQLGIINKYNGKSYLSFWTTPYANMINGSDGSVAHPSLRKTERLFAFSPDVCRSVYGVYNNTDKASYGFPVYRYSAPPYLFANSSVNRDNIGFCTPQDSCMGTGVLNISQCKIVDFFHIPLVLSLPHFLNADPKYQDGVDNLHPDPVQHTTVMDLEPITGILMHAAKRLQINLHIKQYPDIASLSQITPVVLPVLWLNESMHIDHAHVDMLRHQLFLPLKIAHIIQYTSIAVGVLLVATALACFLQRCLCSNLEQEVPSVLDDPNETSPLLNRSSTEEIKS